MWTWDQSAGTLSRTGKSWTGYSGRQRGLNNPAMQNVPGVGPVPRGFYTLGKVILVHPTVGRYAIPLIPDAANDMDGRAGFLIHGDNPQMDHTASHGCIILPLAIRQMIVASGDNRLQVVA